MEYISTRGGGEPKSFEDVILTGLAPDGGLYVPKSLPHYSHEEIASWAGLSYQQLALKVITPFVDGAIPESDLERLIEKSYGNFRHEDIAPLVKTGDNEWILELFHGPTLAFKDFALQFLGNLLDYTLGKRQQKVVLWALPLATLALPRLRVVDDVRISIYLFFILINECQMYSDAK